MQSPLVTVDGVGVNASSLQQNEMMAFIAEHPGAVGKWCTNTSDHDVNACKFAHCASGYMRVDGQAHPETDLEENAAFAFLRANPTKAGRRCTAATGTIHNITTCKFIHFRFRAASAATAAAACKGPRPVPGAVKPGNALTVLNVEGIAVPLRALQDSALEAWLLNHPGAQGKWCTNPAEHDVRACKFAHCAPGYMRVDEYTHAESRLRENAAFAFLRANPRKAGKRCTMKRFHDANACNYVHFKHMTMVTVDGDCVPVDSLVHNPAIEDQVNNAINCHWCKNSAPHDAKTCPNIHRKGEDALKRLEAAAQRRTGPPLASRATGAARAPRVTPAYWSAGAEGRTEMVKVDLTADPVWRKRLQDLLDDTCRKDTLGVGRGNRQAGRGGYSRLVLHRAFRVENSKLYSLYAAHRDALEKPPMPAVAVTHLEPSSKWIEEELGLRTADRNELLLWHGTASSAVDKIAADGFDERFCNLSGVFGAGVYFADEVSKSDQYVDCTPSTTDSRNNIGHVFLARVTVGHFAIQRKATRDARRAPDGCQSIIGALDANKYREFVAYDGWLAYPEFVLQYRRE